MHTITIVRHAEPHNTNRFLGHSQVGLTSQGRQQAHSVAVRLTPQPILTSDLNRAQQTAHIIASHTKSPLHYCSLLRERCYGEWEGLSRNEVSQRYLHLFNRWKLKPHLVTPPGGEPYHQLANRARQFVDFSYSLPNIIIITHIGFIKALLSYCLNLSPPLVRPLVIDYTAVTIISTNSDRWRLHSLNDTCHMSF